VGDAQWRGEKVLLVQPQTYMNRSGEAVAKICNFYHLDPTNLVVIHDDLDLPLGRIRIKRGGGGAGGNRGVVSIIAALGSKDFVRVKIGTGRPQEGGDPARFLLQPFTLQEEAFILPAVDRAASAVEVIFSEGVDKAMTLFHTSDFAEKT
jgi:PTH1 family peptidyl-tRNA hydrolase